MPVLKSALVTYPTALRAAEIPDRPAIACGGVTITYAELERRIIEDASRLNQLAVQAGDRIAIGAANSAEWVILAHAVARVGAALVPLNTRLTENEIRMRLQLLTPRIVLGDESFLSKVKGDLPGVERILLLNSSSGSLSGSERTFSPLRQIEPGGAAVGDMAEPEMICTIVTTSGSSGDPKGVCLTLANHLASAAASHQNLRCETNDRWLVNLPLFHVGGLSIIYRAALCGMTMVIHNAFDAGQTLAAIRNDGVTLLSLVEATLARLLDRNGDQTFPDSVRAVLVGGGPVDTGLLRRARAHGLPVLPTYGLTEAASQVATLHPDAQESDLGRGARPLPLCDVEIRDSMAQRVCAGTEGEIWIRGPMIARGYWRPGGRIEPAAEQGWLETGDIGVLDADGFLSVCGRKDDMIISGGENIYPAEIERALMALPGVRRAAVLGVDDPKWGQVPVALVEKGPGGDISLAGWQELLRNRLAAYKLPKRIIPVDKLPITSIGKIERRRLPELYRRLSDSETRNTAS